MLAPESLRSGGKGRERGLGKRFFFCLQNCKSRTSDLGILQSADSHKQTKNPDPRARPQTGFVLICSGAQGDFTVHLREWRITLRRPGELEVAETWSLCLSQIGTYLFFMHSFDQILCRVALTLRLPSGSKNKSWEIKTLQQFLQRYSLSEAPHCPQAPVVGNSCTDLGIVGERVFKG